MPKTFTLLSIGQRGVGKTVFLAGSYAQVYRRQQQKSQPVWFEAGDDTSRVSMGKLLEYIYQTGQYPPATLGISQFQFSLKRRTLLGPQTLCNFRWQDVPGEICNYDNPLHKQRVWESHGCCLFIDAPALLSKKGYLAATAEAWEQVQAYAYLTSLNRLSYPFALLLTKCDQLAADQLQSPLDQALRPLTHELRRLRANWKVFRSSTVLRRDLGGADLQSTGPEPLLWLISEVSRTQQNGWFTELRDWCTGLIPSGGTGSSQTGTVARALTPAFRPVANSVDTDRT